MSAHYKAIDDSARLAAMGLQLPCDWVPQHGAGMTRPTMVAPLLRRAAKQATDVEVVNGHFGLLKPTASSIQDGRDAYTVRMDRAPHVPTFKGPWRRGQHCIVPLEYLYEPDWRTGAHIPTRFARADGAPLGVAGLWAERTFADGTVALSFAMLTMNAAGHPLFSQMQWHRKRPEHLQEKWMVCILPDDRYQAWLDASPEESPAFGQHYPAEQLVMTPEPEPVAQLQLF